jgi:hypothetical protein
MSANSAGATEPHVRQYERDPCSDERNLATASSPASQWNEASGVNAYVANGAPWCLRHIEQWQCIIIVSGASIS